MAILLKNPDSQSIFFYNVENLFDVHDNPKTKDSEFLPTSLKQWDLKKYYKKLNDLAKVMVALTGYPSIIYGLAEVENRKVVEDLFKNPAFGKTRFEIVHRNSPDPRGIDVAMAYNPEYFEISEYHYIPVVFDNKDIKTRDILYVQGFLYGSDRIHLFINHWPSRRNGERETEFKRLEAAGKLREEIDRISAWDPKGKILIMGDFNDTPDSKSLNEILKAGHDFYFHQNDFYNLHSRFHKEKRYGSVVHDNKWYMLDQILVSASWINRKSGIGIKGNKGKILRKEWMLYVNDKNQAKPNKTYGGTRYYGGYSDHLPVYVNLKYYD